MRDADFQVSFCECDFYHDEMTDGTHPKFFGFTSCFCSAKSLNKSFVVGRYFLGKYVNKYII